MSDLIVRPSYQLGPTEILTSDKLNLMATPVVELALQDPVNDQNFFRNGNFYSSFWTDPAGVSCPAGAWTTNASYWLVRPTGAAVNFDRSPYVPDVYSLFSGEVQGALTVSTVEFGQQINGDLSATLRRNCTFSGYLYNGSGLVISPKLNFYTADAFNNFAIITLQTTVNLQSAPIASWTYMTATLDLSSVANITNGLLVAILIPSGTLNDPAKYGLFSRLKFQIGEIATEFVDDTSLFIQAPSVDSTMLQDGCIARPSLFLPNVIPTGAYQAKSINNGDINDGAIDGRTIAAGAVAGNLGYTPINKAGDTGIGPGALNFVNDDVVGAGSVLGAGAIIATSPANAANDGYMPAIAFNRAGTLGRAIGLSTTGRFRTVDQAGATGYLLDSVFRVATVDLQDQSVTIAKLAAEVINLIIPAGIMAFFSGPTPPGGWLIADGRAVSRTTYAALFAAVGASWGAGDNVSTFNLPDLRGRAPIGYVNSAAPGITGRAFASRGGSETHALAIAELPSHDHGSVLANDSHTHGVNDAKHAHQYVNPLGTNVSLFTGGSGFFAPSGTTASSLELSNISIAYGPSNARVQAQGSGTPLAIMQPYSVGYWIVKS
jgi:microcystin-dependent protein